jgi:hypothetical protein
VGKVLVEALAFENRMSSQLRVSATLPYRPQFTWPGFGLRLAQTLFTPKHRQTVPSRSKGLR